MKREGLKERMELLAIGEVLGFPRLGYGRSTKVPHDKRIPAGQDKWEQFCAHAHVNRVLPALRIGRVLCQHHVKPFHPLSGRETLDLTADFSAFMGETLSGTENPEPERHTADRPDGSEQPADESSDGAGERVELPSAAEAGGNV